MQHAWYMKTLQVRGFLVMILEGNRLRWRQKHRGTNDIKVDRKRYGVRMWTGFTWLKRGDAM